MIYKGRFHKDQSVNTLESLERHSFRDQLKITYKAKNRIIWKVLQPFTL